jgi:ADP-ribosylglycohydrolase
MPSDLALVARVISEGYLPAKSALLQGPLDPVSGSVDPDRIRGMLLGLAIGDALGNTSEGLTPAGRGAAHDGQDVVDYLPNRHAGGRRVGLPSDDTQLAFWTLESLLEHGELQPEDLARRFGEGEIYGLGSTVARFRVNREQGHSPWYRCGVESAGNGALMRIAPIVLLHPQGSSPALWLDAALAAIVTHRDSAAVASCVAFVDLLARLLRLPAPPTPDWVTRTFLATVRRVGSEQPLYRVRGGRHAGREHSFHAYLELALGEAARGNWDSREACEAWHSGAYLLETVPCVLWILARHAHDPEEALVRAVNDTQDNDTVAAIVGAAVGALHGASALPERWRWGLLGRTRADDDGQVFRLVEAAVRRVTPA